MSRCEQEMCGNWARNAGCPCDVDLEAAERPVVREVGPGHDPDDLLCDSLAAHAVDHVWFDGVIEFAVCKCGGKFNDPDSAYTVPELISHPEHQAAMLSAAGWSVVRRETVTTVDELDALPNKTVIRCGNTVFDRCNGLWFGTGDPSEWELESRWLEDELPATVLWLPEDGA